jgi:hypothetical protein
MGQVEPLGTAQAASILGVSVMRVRQMLHAGLLAGELDQRGSRARWRVDSHSVAEVLASRQAQGRSTLTLAALDQRLARLEAGATGKIGAATNAEGQIVADALTLRAIAAEQAAADAARSRVIDHLLAALRLAEEADAHRRAATARAVGRPSTSPYTQTPTTRMA